MNKKNVHVCMVLWSVLFFSSFCLWGEDFHVTTEADGVPGSLRAAISAVNSTPGNHVVHIPPGTYILSGQPDEDANTGGDLDIDTPTRLYIIGENPETVIIDGNRNDRVFHIIRGNITISNVTIRGGRSFTPHRMISNTQDGGGIYNAGSLRLWSCIVTRNSLGPEPHSGKRGCGGGIYNTGALELSNCTIHYNLAGSGTPGVSTGAGGNGGGIANHGTLTIADSTISRNEVGCGAGPTMYSYCTDSGCGGGIYNGSDGILTINSGAISYNTAGTTGGIKRDFSPGDGGGLFNRGSMSISCCLIDHNRTCDGANFIIDYLPFATRGGAGAGIYHHSEIEAVLANCTITSNRTGDGGEDYWDGFSAESGGNGGGIFNRGTMRLTGCTVCDNQTGEPSETAFTDDITGGNGGGIINFDGSVYLQNTLLANNTVGTRGKGRDFYGNAISNGCNLIRNTEDMSITGYSFGDQTGIDPLLLPLGDNGGPSLTHALQAGSPAVDAGTGAGLSTDQRGYARPIDIAGTANFHDGSDIGAFELSTPYGISGRITSGGQALEEVTLDFSNNGGSAVTGPDGYYTHPVPAGWAGAVTPSKEDYSFDPFIRWYTTITGSHTGEDYIALPNGIAVSITSPGHGDTVSGKVTLQAAVSRAGRAESAPPGFSVSFYVDGALHQTLSEEPFQVTWNTSSYTGGEHTVSVKAVNTAGEYAVDQVTVTVANTPHISVTPSRLAFRKLSNGSSSPGQEILITNSGTGALNWTLVSDRDWLYFNVDEGANDREVRLAITGAAPAAGVHTAVLTVSSAAADNSPVYVPVTLEVLSDGEVPPPFGRFDTPGDGALVSGSVPFTGWALDAFGYIRVHIYRDPVDGEGGNRVYIGEAVMVEGARSDIELLYPGYPGNHKAGWGYMMLTHFLPNGGNGTFTFHVEAEGSGGKTAILGSKTIRVDNAAGREPFGAIDLPAQGGVARGARYFHAGWALTPLPNTIPPDGSTITVWVDSMPVGHPVYNRFRQDIQDLFQGYNNSGGAVGYLHLDTTAYQSGLHTIAWSVEDDAGNAAGIGSRYFKIYNSGISAMGAKRAGVPPPPVIETLAAIPFEKTGPVLRATGFDLSSAMRPCFPGPGGDTAVRLRETELLRLDPGLGGGAQPGDMTGGYLQVGEDLRPLPAGSRLDAKTGCFYWLPGPGFLGTYRLVFIKRAASGKKTRRHITVNILPKFGG